MISEDSPAQDKEISAKVQKLLEKIEELDGKLNSSTQAAPPQEKLQQKVAELEERLNSSTHAVFTPAQVDSAPVATTVTINDADEEPNKSTSTFFTLWGGPIMPSEDQTLW